MIKKVSLILLCSLSFATCAYSMDGDAAAAAEKPLPQAPDSITNNTGSLKSPPRATGAAAKTGSLLTLSPPQLLPSSPGAPSSGILAPPPARVSRGSFDAPQPLGLGSGPSGHPRTLRDTREEQTAHNIDHIPLGATAILAVTEHLYSFEIPPALPERKGGLIPVYGCPGPGQINLPVENTKEWPALWQEHAHRRFVVLLAKKGIPARSLGFPQLCDHAASVLGAPREVRRHFDAPADPAQKVDVTMLIAALNFVGAHTSHPEHGRLASIIWKEHLPKVFWYLHHFVERRCTREVFRGGIYYSFGGVNCDCGAEFCSRCQHKQCDCESCVTATELYLTVHYLECFMPAPVFPLGTCLPREIGAGRETCGKCEICEKKRHFAEAIRRLGDRVPR